MYKIDKNGFYGEFGGSFVDQTTQSILDNLCLEFEKAKKEKKFLAELNQLLNDYAGRPSPLYFSENMSKTYNCKIYLKREDLNHTGSHKINNTIGQILLAKRMGKKRVIAETGAGQHGVATATVCALLKMECMVFMGATDMERQKPNVEKMRMLGAKVVSVTSGIGVLNDAVNDALEYWAKNSHDTFYLLGSAVGPHPYPKMVAFFQSIISKEIKSQLKKKEGRKSPDYVLAAVGGGSNASGAFFHFINDKHVTLIAAEAGGMGAESGKSAAAITIGKPGVIHGFKSLVMVDENGAVLEPYSISAGLDYPSVGPLFAHLAKEKRLKTVAITDKEAIDAAFELTRSEGIIPAIESAHAIAALNRFQFKKSDIVVVNLSGRGDKDMETYLRLQEK